MDQQSIRLLRAIGRDHIIEQYKSHGRYIPKDVYDSIKSLRECENCHLKFNQPPYIHHKIAVRDGGTVERENLLGVCYECHEKLDLETLNNKYVPTSELGEELLHIKEILITIESSLNEYDKTNYTGRVQYLKKLIKTTRKYIDKIRV